MPPPSKKSSSSNQVMNVSSDFSALKTYQEQVAFVQQYGKGVISEDLRRQPAAVIQICAKLREAGLDPLAHLDEFFVIGDRVSAYGSYYARIMQMNGYALAKKDGGWKVEKNPLTGETDLVLRIILYNTITKKPEFGPDSTETFYLSEIVETYGLNKNGKLAHNWATVHQQKIMSWWKIVTLMGKSYPQLTNNATPRYSASDLEFKVPEKDIIYDIDPSMLEDGYQDATVVEKNDTDTTPNS